MTKFALGRDQVITLDGTPLVGTREFDVQIEMQEADVTDWRHGQKSTLPIANSQTVRVLIYWLEAYNKVAAKYNQHPPQKMTLGITGYGTIYVLPTSVRIGCPIDGLVTWDCTFKGWGYN
jgi:hypothetical protein